MREKWGETVSIGPGFSINKAIMAVLIVLIALGALLYTQGCKQPGAIDTITLDEPPVNPFVADSPWPMSHANPYCQASSLYPGPTKDTSEYKFDYLGELMYYPPITVAISGAYPDGNHVLWGNTPAMVFKAGLDGGRLSYIEKIEKEPLNVTLSLIECGLSNAYTLVDCEGTFFVPSIRKIFGYGDEVPGDPYSKIVTKRVFEIPEDQLRSEDEFIAGLNIAYDGMLVFITNKATVGVVSRSFDSAHFLHLGEDEETSNSIACDEDDGIYVVTSKHMYRVQWTGDRLTTNESEGGWIANYETGGEVGGIRLGMGSGSTPTLMGTGEQDKLVVITDGQDLMHIVLFWRDKIPPDWVQIPGTKDRRIAAQIPVPFGNPEATESSSEQSVCVRGYGALVVNNQLNTTSEDPIINIVMSQYPDVAPYGAEKFEWNPQTQELRSVWVNEEVSLPNGIPAMSAATNLIYDIGQRSGNWTWEALDWDTGKSVFSYEIGSNLEYNSCWAATEIGLDGRLYSGSVTGMMCLHPDGS